MGGATRQHGTGPDPEPVLRRATVEAMASLVDPVLPDPRQRLDKWLWFARVMKSRTGAAKLVEDGHVRVNAVRVENPAKGVRGGDVLTIALDRQVRVLKVRGLGERRGPFEEARLLYEDVGSPGVTEDSF